MSKATDISARRSRLSPVKQSLLEKRLKGYLKEPSKSSAIEKRPDQSIFPLSFAQKRFWFLDQLEPGSPVYNRPMALGLKGALNITALEQAINAILRRHDVLRANFSAIQGSPIQSIAPTLFLNLDVKDLSDLDAADRENESLRLSVEEAHRPFDLAKDPLLRARLFRLGMEDYILLVVIHHIACDGWSAGVFNKELAALYEAFRAGKSSPLPELPIQYADYAYWQRRWLQGEVFDRLVSYWRVRLADSPPLLNLPTDRPRRSTQTYCGAYQTMMLSSSLLKSLKALSRAEGVTLFMTLLAAFKVLLYRYTGQKDIVVGSPIAGRSHIETEGLIGFFVNTLVLRTDLSGNPSFRQLLHRVCEVALGAYEHGDLPLEKVVEVLQPERDLGRSPFFQMLFNLENVPEENISLPQLIISEFEFDSAMTAFDLSVEILEKKEELYCLVNYRTDLFDSATIARMVGHYRTLLESIVANPDQSISRLSFLTEPERHQMVIEWNDTQTDYPKDKCIHELFEEQVKKTPDSIAVVYEGDQLTYRELNRCANQLANYLQTLGVSPEVLIGLFTERSLETVIGILGILKAGGAYVPLDPLYPKERLSLMLADINAPVLLTQQHLLDKLPENQAHVVILDTFQEQIARGSDNNPTSDVIIKNAAYVLYTSGSTGMPKGVVAEHKQVLNYCIHIINRLNLADGYSFAMVQPITFDSCLTVIFPSLITGGTLHVVSTEKALSPEGLCNYFQNFPIDCLKITPSHLSAIQALVKPDLIMPKRCLVIGGEESNWQWVQSLESLSSKCTIFNHYGPVETTCGVLTYRIEKRGDDTNYLTTPIGRPIANIQIYILDDQLNPLPVGVEGELYIGGDGVTRGYLNRPDRTAAQFIPNPFIEKPGERLYRSGDRARYLPDGNIEFLGRRDHQVKIRGFRVELGEIEATLEQHQAVRQAVVMGREDIPGDKRLVGYVIADQKRASTSNDLRHFLKKKLPGYMVPSSFVFLDSLPVTPNGKVDRLSLPAPNQIRPKFDCPFVAPINPTEQVVAEIWSNLLGIEKIGTHDNFFDLGGHSLLATQIVSRLRGSFEIDILLRNIFEAPTVAELAKLIEASLQTVQTLQAPPLQAVEQSKDLPLSLAQKRLWFLNQLEPESPLYNRPRAVRLTGSLNVEALQKSLDTIVTRHEALRTMFASIDGSPIQIITEPRSVDLPVIDLGELQAADREAEVRRLCAKEAQRPFDLSSDSMMRVSLYRLEKQEHVLMIVMHHIITDHWSWGILFREISEFYNAFKYGRSPTLPSLPIQYADFAVWQRQWLHGEVLEKQLTYWKQQLDGVPPVLELPSDRPRLTLQTHRGARQAVVLSKKLSEALKKLSRQEGVTLFMILLTAFKILLHRYTGQDDIVVGSPSAGRSIAEVEGLIGFFLNTLVLRTDLSGTPNFRELLRRVREVSLEAYENQNLPFEKLVEELQPKRDLNRSPLFQVFFNMYNFEESRLEIDGLKVKYFSPSELTANFDLTLYVRRQDEKILLQIVYDADLFYKDRMFEMLNQLTHLLSQIVQNPAKNIASYCLLTPESKPLLPDPSIVLAEPLQKLVMNMFARWVERTPEKEAVSQGEHSWTYAELAECADMLAHELTARGVEKGDVIALYGPRSFGLIAGMLGVLLCGGVMLPLDRSLPDQRKQQMLREASAKCLVYVGERRIEDIWLKENTALDLLCVDADTAHALEDYIGANLATIHLPAASPDDPAYIFFTSGTTGVPNGVLGCHKSLSHFLNWQGETFEVGPQDRVAQLTNLSFDVVLRDIFLPLTHGATLCLPEEKDSLEPKDILNWLEREQISILHVVPTLAQTWLDDIPENISLSFLRLVFFAGEPLTDSLVDRWRAAFPSAEIINFYGPTETTMTKCFYHLQSDVFPGVQPLGHPMPQTQALVIANNNRLCGIGEIGEIVIRTPFRSLGYINSPEANQQRFVKNPFQDDEKDLLYYTGDLGRYRPDGTLEILGRCDDQVKIRGVRIEPDEVTAALCRHPNVKTSIVVAKEGEQGQIFLVAYVVASNRDRVTLAELMFYLSQQLPPAMVPARYVFLDVLPMTPNGKINRKALPEPEQSSIKRKVAFIPPRDPMEEELARIWADLLSVELIGSHDNFFELGGHSLLATRVISQIRKIFQVEIPLRRLFEAATVAELANVIATCRQEVQELKSPPLQAEERDKGLPLSFAQQRLWFLDQFEPESPLYNIPWAIRLSGPFNIDTLQRSLAAIVDRHEALRTTYTSVNGSPTQVIADARSVDLSIIDLSGLSAVDRESEVKQLCAKETRRPFDLTSDLMMRARLYRLNKQEHVLLFVIHHIASDGWSMGVLFRELSILYEAFSAGKPSPLPDLAIQYADFAVWQRQWLQKEVLKKQLAYWQQQLDGAAPALELPTDRPRAAVQSFRGTKLPIKLSKSLTQALKTLCRQEGVTLYMVLLAAFKVLLHRYTAQDDIIIGSPIANRNRTEIEGLIGFFVNTLVMRTDLSGNVSFRKLLARVRKVALEAYAHQDIPFEKLVEELQPERNFSHSPLFQIMFVFQNVPQHAMQLSGLTLSPMDVDVGSAKFDLTLFLKESTDGIKGSLQYSTDLFDKETIARMIGHFQTLLKGIVANPDRSISKIQFLTESELNQLLFDWNDPPSAYPRDRCVHQLFEQQVEQTPDAVAVVYEDEQLTYRQLNARSNQLAHYLKKLGVGAEVLVGICLERSVEMVIGLLGILKAGGAYVPLDPSYPKERLNFILNDAQAQVLLTEKRLLDILLESPVHTVCLDTDRESIEKESTENPAGMTSTGNLAYVIYTSGSTGRPKGVGITHSNSIALLYWAKDTFNSEDLVGVLASTSICFDLSVFELFFPLSSGGKVILAENVLKLINLDSAEDVTLVNTVPSAIAELLRLGDLPYSVRAINLAGEPLKNNLVKQIYQSGKVSQVLDLYGPSEDTTYSTFALRDGDGPATIGRPISNCQIYLLDVHMQPVPIGVPGEIYIGGDGLARGYLHRPDLTAEKFIPNPFSNNSGERLYKTGDFARYLLDGKIEFLGRMDQQVKIRGFRIELGEIEAALGQHSTVRDTVVIAREDVPGDKLLVAYVVPKSKIGPTINELRSYLKQRLPDYMVPSVFVIMDFLPLTPNGKVDRRALPMPSRERPDLVNEFVAPRTPIEQTIAGIWSNVLKVDRVGIYDNFFKLGGHSLLATQVISRIRHVLEVDLPIRCLFEEPTIAGLAETIIQYQIKQDKHKEIERLLKKIEGLSDKDVKNHLDSET